MQKSPTALDRLVRSPSVLWDARRLPRPTHRARREEGFTAVNRRMFRQMTAAAGLVAAATLVLSGCASPQAGESEGGADGATQLRMGTQPWLGYGQWYVAEDQGFFADQGVEVELTSFSADADVNAALAAKKLDMASVASHTALQFVENGVDVSIVLMLDTATGADAILTDGSISSVEGLKGQKVAYEEGATSELLLGDALDRAGLTFDDIERVPMGADEAGTALIAGSVPAAVTYEPYVSSALGAGKGIETLVTAAEHEGLISDVLVVRNDVLEAETEAVRAVIAAWGDSLDFYEANTDEARAIIAAGVGSNVEELASAFDGVHYFTLAENAEMLDGSYRDETLPAIIKVASRIGMIEGTADPKSIVDASFLPQP